MMLIRHVIQDREPYSMNASARVQDAAEFMASRNIGAVCVLDDAGKLLGVFSERDVLRRVVVQASRSGVGESRRRYQRAASRNQLR